MKGTRGHGDRGSRERKGAKRSESAAPKRKYAQTIYGKVPLVEKSIDNGYGKVYRFYEYDFDFCPPLPANAVRGNVHRQRFCSMCHAPKYYYLDEAKTCVQCGLAFVFTAKEQKYWYETLQFHFDSVAIRCPPCRKKKRSEKALREQMAAAQATLTQAPDDPHALLSDAAARVRYFQRTGEGNLDRAIASAGWALKLWPKATEALFWEGLAHQLADRPAKATPLLQAFIENSSGNSLTRSAMLREAQALLNPETERTLRR